LVLYILSRICGYYYRRGMDWIIGFIALVTTGNYSAIVNIHDLRITTAPAKPFPASCVLTSRSLATASNRFFNFKVLPSSTLVQNYLPSIPSTKLDRHLFLVSPEKPKCTEHSALPNLNSLLLRSLCADRIENTVPNNLFIVDCVSVAAETCLPSRCLAVYVSSGPTIPYFRRHITIYCNHINPWFRLFGSSGL
jgi:hypothetical protein